MHPPLPEEDGPSDKYPVGFLSDGALASPVNPAVGEVGEDELLHLVRVRGLGLGLGLGL